MALLSLACLNSSRAAEPVDTVKFTVTNYKVVADESTNSNGKKTIKYYVIADNNLIPTTKSTADRIRVCKKFGVTPNLLAIVTKKKEIKKIICI